MPFRTSERNRIINSFYEFNSEDLEILRQVPIESKEQWSEEKKYKPIKQRIKEFLISNQNKYCAYCRMEIDISGSNFYPEMDHIIPKEPYFKLLLTGKNLILCCSSCNRHKRDKDVLNIHIDPNDLTDCPTDSENYSIINPYLDSFFDHIKFDRSFNYLAIPNNDSQKGYNTIEICKLNRENLRKKRHIYAKSQSATNGLKLVFEAVYRNSRDALDELMRKIN